MVSNMMTNRIKAAAIAALMCVSVAATAVPITTGSSMDVYAAAVTVGEELDSTSKTGSKYVGKVSDLGVTDLKKLTFTVQAPYTGNMSYGFGISTAEDPYWMEYDGKKWVDTKEGTVEVPGIEVKVTKGAKTTITIDTSDLEVSPTGTFEFRNYYSADWSSGDEEKVPITLVSVEGTGTASEDPTDETDETEETDDTTKETTETDETEETTKETKPASGDDTVLGEDDVFTGYWADYATSGIKNVAITFTADYTGSTSLGMGIGVAAKPWWYEWDATTEKWVDTSDKKTTADGWSVAVEEGETYTVVYDVSKYELSYNPKDDEYPGHFEFRNYYGGEDGKGKITVTDVEVNSKKTSNVTEPEEPVDPVDEHDKSKHDGSTSVNPTTGDGWSYKDGVLTATLARQQEFPKDPLTLTVGYDEEYYAKEGIKPEEGKDPINSHKFSYTSFGMSGVGDTVIVESLLATITSKTPIKTFMYGGGLNVVNESPADTESAKAKKNMAVSEDSGYWYNDMGQDRVKEYEAAGVEFGITPTFGYFIEADEKNPLGTYFSVYWDVPTEVKQYEQNGDISFQYWYGVEDTEEYTEVEAVDLIGGLITYTQTENIKDAGKATLTVNEKISEGKTSSPISYADADLDAWNEVKALVFTLDVGADLDKLVYGAGTSVRDEFKMYSPEDENWDYVMLNTKKGEVQIVWFVPTGVIPNVEAGNFQFGYWYGAKGEDELDSVTLKSVDIYYSEGVEPTEPPTKATEPTTEATTEATTEDPFVPLWGDANCDGDVDIMDVILTNKYLLGTGTMTDHGKINANVDLVNEKIDTTDSLNILKLVVELLTQADMPIKP